MAADRVESFVGCGKEGKASPGEGTSNANGLWLVMVVGGSPGAQ
jgi:hypothetical protein